MQAASERWRDHGFDLDFAELVYLGDRNEAAELLGATTAGSSSGSSVSELFAANGLRRSTTRERRQLRASLQLRQRHS